MPSGCASGSRSSPAARSPSTAASTRRARNFGRSSGCAPATSDGPWRSSLPAAARSEGGEWIFELPESGPEPMLKALIDGGAGIETLAIERPGLHEAFVAIAGDAAAACHGRTGRARAVRELIRAAFVIARRDFYGDRPVAHLPAVPARPVLSGADGPHFRRRHRTDRRGGPPDRRRDRPCRRVPAARAGPQPASGHVRSDRDDQPSADRANGRAAAGRAASFNRRNRRSLPFSKAASPIRG